ncbi:hypothetical protein A3A67_00120 [Candidatus Peribacteria bacterium RIFCSPLOWO2_01_FULL_51_18]|nr:MAG: hypothetical protein A3C52_00255 [Candidatus Peribacteria bacterium RIFCSPHIGHO2_02_FULL_51_15]OGJ65301.1 MAG: hypothetical protein A3A67_00120 [Candidatus Peribacteria bacterium RIFCSPLOWO2_01_FULL_51_18]OGJ69181.1 MAG: hypothetical protein A3J34_02580 [Candidatus Peribacteria bacterium RIFCSPLOWO2_02_FULL_51_10]
MLPDDDLELSGSDQSKLESFIKAERKALDQKIKKAGLEKKINPATADKNRLKLNVLKQQLAEKKEDGKKKEQSKSFGTKTREQEIAAAKLTAETKPTPDRLVLESKQEEAVKREQQKEEIQQESTS